MPAIQGLPASPFSGAVPSFLHTPPQELALTTTPLHVFKPFCLLQAKTSKKPHPRCVCNPVYYTRNSNHRAAVVTKE